MEGLLYMSHLSEMLAVFTHEYHYTSPAYKRHTTLRSCGVYCTSCVSPLRGDGSSSNNRYSAENQ